MRKNTQGFLTVEFAVYQAVYAFAVVGVIAATYFFGSGFYQSTLIKEKTYKLKNAVELYYRVAPRMEGAVSCVGYNHIPKKTITQLANEGYITGSDDYSKYNLTVKKYSMNGIEYPSGVFIDVDLDNESSAKRMLPFISFANLKDTTKIEMYFAFDLADIDYKHFNFDTGCYLP